MQIAVTPPPEEAGLTEHEAKRLLARHGPNVLAPRARRFLTVIRLVRLAADPMTLLLIAAGVVYFALGDRLDGTIVLVAVVPIAAVTLALELRAERALDALRRLTAPTALVWRDGEARAINAEDLVPGDLLLVQEGDVVPADGAVIAASQLQADESALTGESLSVAKSSGMPGEEGRVYAGSHVVSGRAFVRVDRTGPRTRYGQIGSLLAKGRQTRSPLERSMRRLVSQLGIDRKSVV
jgi:Ca2+-transporting ATPase